MRILFLAHRLPYPPNKGDKIRSFWELKAMSGRHEVDLFCFYDDQQDAQYIPELRKFCRSCYAEPLSPMGSRLRALFAVATRRPFSTAYYYSPRMAQKVRRALHERTYDLIFVFSSSMAQYAGGTSIPAIADFVDVDSDKWQQYARQMRAPRSWLWTYEARQLARYEDAVARRFSATILCTEAEARILRKRVPGSPVFAVNNFLDMSSYDPEATSVTAEVRALQPYVVFSGQMDYYPNVDAAEYFCREVFPAVRAQMPELKFVIVGRNPAPSVRRLAADPAIQVTGAVPDVRPYLRGAAAAVAPLRIARGVQNKVLEAMAMGVPVVTSGAVAAALPPDLAAHCGVEDDPRIMAVKLIRLLREQKTTPVASLRKAVIAHFGNPDLDLQLETILQQAVRTGNAGRAAGAASVAGSASSVVAGEEKRPVPLSS